MTSALRTAAWLLGAIALGCAGDDATDDLSGGGGGLTPDPPPEDERRGDHDDLEGAREALLDALVGPAPEGRPPRRGLGRVTARVPGTTATVEGVRIVSHHVRATVQGGFARTEIEEELQNDTDRVLEGRFVFPVPPGATVSRLALWVGDELVEGEVLERGRATRIFRGIVEDTVRPRDPALLEWVRGAELSLTIFPIPARSSRKVVLAYDEVLARGGGRDRWLHALSLGPERATPLEDLRVSVRVVGHGAVATAEGWDAVVTPTEEGSLVEVAAGEISPDRDLWIELPAEGEEGVSIARFEAEAAEGPEETFSARWTVPEPPTGSVRPSERVLVLDRSDSQSKETLSAQARLAASAIAAMEDTGRFAVLWCDAACDAYPPEGLATRGDAAREELSAFLDGASPGGASDLAGAVAEGLGRISPEARGQLVVLSDGSPTAGELSAPSIEARLAPLLGARPVDLRLIGVGRSVDEVTLRGLASALDASFEPLASEGRVAERARLLAAELDRPLWLDAMLELPPGFEDVSPRALPALRTGEAVTIFGARGRGGATGGVATLRGVVGGEEVAVSLPLLPSRGGANPLLPKLRADRQIADLEGEGAAARDAIVALSKRHHVLSRHTAFLVLENERMFREFGVDRTTTRPEDEEDHAFGRLAAAPPELGQGAAVPDGAQGFGAGTGRLGGRHVTKSPMIRMGMTMVSGRLPPEVVQRIVRMNMGRFRACYERGLMRDPSLGGRVVTRFVIGRTGRVSGTSDAGSDLPDAEVVACVVRNFQFLDFPQPEGGIVTVTYPIVFSSDGTRPQRPATLWPEVMPPERAYVPPPQPAWLGRRIAPPKARSWVTHLVQHALEERRAWEAVHDSSLARLATAAQGEPASRSRRERWIRGLVTAGRFDQAVGLAAELAAQDPDLPLARELLAQTAAATGDGALARRELGALVELDPRSISAHRRAALSHQGASDPRRACAHLRSLPELERGAGRDDAERCWEAIVARGPLPRGAESTGSLAMTATIRCESPTVRCPEVAIVTPTGRVVSRGAPFGAQLVPGGIGLPSAGEGVFRTAPIGGDERAIGTIEVTTHGRTARLAFGGASPARVVTTRIVEQWTREPVIRY